MPQTPSHSRPERAHPTERGADEHEFEAFVQDQDPLDITAATWVTRRRSGLSAEGEAQLQAWLEADPRHAQAYEDMDATFGDLRRLPNEDVSQLRAAALPRARQPAPIAWGAIAARLPGLLRPLAPRFTAAAAAFSMVVGGWLGWSHWQRQPVFEQAYATARGQWLNAALPDADRAAAAGSTLQLDTATRTQVRLYRDRREVHLHSGQAMFAVHSDPQRPFLVYAGALRISVVGTRFSVRHTGTGLDAGQTVVTVEEGRVRVENRLEAANGSGAANDISASEEASAAPVVELTAGQAVVADAQGHIGTVTSMSAGAIAPWRNGRLSFDQTPLAQAIAEFERYGRTGLVVRDPAVAALPVGGSYSLKQWRHFAQTLPQVLPVRLVNRGEVMEVVAR